MKQRLLVMNGQLLVQSEHEGTWSTDKVEKAGAVRPGIYNIHLAINADRAKTHDGTILYVDSSSVYQQVGKSYVKHARVDFMKLPEIGTTATVSYDEGKMAISSSARRSGRKIS